MSFDAHNNFAYSTVLTAPSPAASGTELTLQAGAGALFPAAPFNCTVWPADAQPTDANAEIVRVTAIVGDVLTITREQEGTAARTILVGDQFAETITAKAFTDIEAAIPAVPARLSFTQNFPIQQAGVVLIGAINSTGITAASATNNPFGSSLSLQRIFLPAPMSLTEVDLAFGIAFPATNQGQGSMSQSLMVYSFGNSTSLATVLSASRAVSWASGTTTAGTASSLQQGWAGNNVQPFTFAASNLSAGEYAVAHLLSWAAESTSWTVSVYGGNAQSSLTASAVTNLTSASLAAAASFITGSSALTAFSGVTSAGVMTSAGLLAGSFFTATGIGNVLSNSATGASGFLSTGGLLAGSFFTASGSGNVLSNSATGAYGFLSTGGFLAGSFFTTSGSGSMLSNAGTAVVNLGTALNVSSYNSSFIAPNVPDANKVVSGTLSIPIVLNSVSTAVGACTAAGGIWSASISSSATAKTATWNLVFQSSNSNILSSASLVTSARTDFSAAPTTAPVFLTATGTSVALIAGSVHTASTSQAITAFSAAPVSAPVFLTATGTSVALSAGSVLTSSASAAITAFSAAPVSAPVFLTATGTSVALIGASAHTASGSAGVLSNSGTAGYSLAASMTTGSLGAVTNAAVATGASTLMTSGVPSFAYNGSFAMTTNTTQASYLNGKFLAGMMLTGSWLNSIDLRSTAVRVTGSAALVQPWFALLGS